MQILTYVVCILAFFTRFTFPVHLNDTTVSFAAQDQDIRLLREYADIVSIAYCTDSGLQLGVIGDGTTSCSSTKCRDVSYANIEIVGTFDFNRYGSIGSGFYGIDHVKKVIYLAFRGSTTRTDWFANLDFFHREYKPLSNIHKKSNFKCPGCKVHRGFYNFVEDHLYTILENVLKLKEANPSYQLVSVGHSLGGAFALLGGIEFLLMKYEPLVVSFAGPRVGNEAMMAFVDEVFHSKKVSEQSLKHHRLDNGFIRVVHIHDLIPHLPPRSLGYLHGGVEYVIESKTLPHNKVKRKGYQVSDDNDNDYHASIFGSTFGGLQKNFPDILTKHEHIHYFTRITGCM